MRNDRSPGLRRISSRTSRGAVLSPSAPGPRLLRQDSEPNASRTSFDSRTTQVYPGLMARRLTASALRENIYRILDQITETGIPVEIERHGKVLKIVLEEPPGKLANLRPRPYLLGEPEDLVHLDWSGEGRP